MTDIATRHRRARTPSILQLEAVECGAAALGMILAHFGRFEPTATLRRECGVSRDGSKASSILKAARRYGMLAKGYSKEIAGLLELPPPYIIFWKFNHFVVVEGIERNRVYLNDPATGHRVVDRQEFEKGFTGVVLDIKPGPDFEKGGRRPSATTALVDRLRGAMAALQYCVLAGFLLVIPSLTLAGLNQVFLDDILLERRGQWLRPVLLAMAVTLLLQGSLRFLQLRYLRRLKIALAIKLSSRFFWHILQLPAMFYAQRYAGEIANRSRINDKLSTVLSGKLAQTAIDVVMLVFFAAMMFFYDVVLTFVGLAVAAINIFVLRWISRRRVESNMRVLQEYGKAQGTALAGLQSIETIKASGLESKFFEKWSGYQAKATNARQDLQLSNQTLGVLPGVLRAVAMTFVIVLGGYRITQGHMTIGMLVAFQTLMRYFLAPISNLVNLGSLLQELRGDLERVDDVLKSPAQPAPTSDILKDDDGRSVVRLKGYVELKNVTFGFSPLEPPLLEDLNLSIHPGQRIALVGASGSGKTTISKLISGELEPWDGEVLMDGRPWNEVPERVRVNSFSIVEQDTFLFGGTVRENLTLWDSTVSDENLIRACEDAAVLEAVLEIPGGLNGEIAEGGRNVSGGQAQRLEIARALVNNPSILVLDEATSALDAETERIVLSRLKTRGCSCVIVAHRLSTIRDCDEIIVMDRGKVVERGTHDELMAKDSAYARLIRSDDDLLGNDE
ncbi:MAG: NHLP family bacteriocin export ABC transporter peptidase/permease/ATPase subunit [Planctomycetes bacterium]|nr:NHLP family bacteriocin export ABC transporter peptidase/permease/ATPase subunit [Planctomycetota bacterium]